MSQVFTAVQICERALRAIGAFAITDSAADGEHTREAMYWLDLIMAERAGTGRLFNLVPETLSIPLTNGTQSYNLRTTLGANLPTDDIQFPVGAVLVDDQGNRTPLTIVSLSTFEAVSKLDETGVPCRIYIDHIAATPTLKTYPTPAADDTKTYTVLLDVQTYAPNVAPGGVTGTALKPQTLTNFRVSWQRWLIAQLSHDLGSGPIFKLPETSLNRFAKMAAEAKTLLEAFENREQITEDPVCEPNGFM